MGSSLPKDELRPTPELSPEDEKMLLEDVKAASQKLHRALEEVNRVVWGQEDVVELTLTCAVAGGNVLLEGVPGLAKTLFLQNLAPIMSLDFNRVQFTPDLMPADILGSEILQGGNDKKSYVIKHGQAWERENDGSISFNLDGIRIEETTNNSDKRFEFKEGPVFTQLLMADEINRAGPRTQAALLQAMQEKEVSIAGETRRLSNPFMVVATQNPLEQDGTYPLPEAQLDRFLLKVNLDYPNRDAERRVLVETTSSPFAKYKALKERRASGEDITVRKHGANKLDVNPVFDSAADLVEMQELAKTLPLSEGFTESVLSLVRQTRKDNKTAPEMVKDHVAWGAGPRALQAFAQAARARALIDGRLAPDNDDIKALAKPILGHRMAVSYAAKASGITTDKVIDYLIEKEIDKKPGEATKFFKNMGYEL